MAIYPVNETIDNNENQLSTWAKTARKLRWLSQPQCWKSSPPLFRRPRNPLLTGKSTTHRELSANQGGKMCEISQLGTRGSNNNIWVTPD